MGVSGSRPYVLCSTPVVLQRPVFETRGDKLPKAVSGPQRSQRKDVSEVLGTHP